MTKRIQQRDAVDAFLIPLIKTRLGKSLDPDDGLPVDWGLNYGAREALTTWLEHDRYGTLPEMGAYNDQDPQLVMEDWGVINRRYNELWQLLIDHKDDDPEIDAPDWIEGLIDE